MTRTFTPGPESTMRAPFSVTIDGASITLHTVDGRNWPIGPAQLERFERYDIETTPTPCPTPSCPNTLAPDQTECPDCRVARIEFECAGFVFAANEYAREKGAMTTTRNATRELLGDALYFEVRARSASDPDLLTGTDDDNPCHYCDNANANADGLCPSCQAREEADAATWYDLTCTDCGNTIPTLGENLCPSERKHGQKTFCDTCRKQAEDEYYADLAEMRAGQRAEDRTNGGIEPDQDAIEDESWQEFLREQASGLFDNLPADRPDPMYDPPCIECGAPIPEAGEYCPDCAQESVPEDVKAMKPRHDHSAHIKAAFVALFALFLFAPTTHAAAYVPTAPVGCTITGTSGEGFPLAECNNGDTYYQDMDGSINRAPGAWVLTN